jgi:FkbM family methyltransferase
MCGMRWVVGSMPHGAWLGILERYKLTRFIKRLRPGMTVWDIGANVGLYTLPSAHAVGPTAHVYAFEPLPRNLGYLHQHIALNHLANVVIVPAAVGDSRGFLRMAEGNSPSEFHVDPLGDIIVPAIVLDDWLAEMGSSPPDLVKIDIEGAENAVLRGGAHTFSKHRPPIYLALHGERQRQECGALLSDWGYRLASLERGHDPDFSSEWLAEPT